MIWKTVKRKIKDLLPAGYNPRTLSVKEEKDLRASIEEFGKVVPIVINTDNRIIGGHQRIKIYADLGEMEEEVDVRMPSRKLNEEEEKRLNLRLNKNVGSWDKEKLKDIDIETLLDVGFEDEDLSDMWDDVLSLEEDEFDAEKERKKIKDPHTKTGEIYELGKHRLMCGDSFEKSDVDTLMGETKANVIYCDPPYNISLSYSKGVDTKGKYKGSRTGTEDRMSREDYTQGMQASIENALENSEKDVHVFYWCDENYIGALQEAFINAEIALRRVCLWIKNNQYPKPQVAFNKVYEACVYGIVGKPYLSGKHKNFHEVLNQEVGTGNQMHDDIMDMFNIWLVKRDVTQDYEHPTQKPVSLAEKPLRRCSKPGDVILDLFGGSGSTLIACEQLGRKTYMMEQDPAFCDLIIKRYEQYTGKKAKRI